LTDVDGVYLDWCTSEQRAIASGGPQNLESSQFEPGSMRPKVEAAIAFARQTGKPAKIGRLEDAVAMLKNSAGTTIDASQVGLVMRH
jgi:carbamate kinase